MSTRLIAELCRDRRPLAAGERIAREHRHRGVGRRSGNGRDAAQRGRHGDVPGQVAAAARASRCSTLRSDARRRSDRARSSTLARGTRRAAGRRPLPAAHRPRQRAASTGFEALARIAERDGTILPPGDFISVAEDNGLVVPLGTQVLEMACEEARRWQPLRSPVAPLDVAVNLSSRQFGRGDLPSVVRDAASRPVSRRLPASRAHRDGDHRPAPRHPAAARADQGPRRADRPRRLRHRLRLAHPSARACR